LKDLQNTSHKGGFSNAGPTRNNHHFMLTSLPDCFLLSQSQLDAQPPQGTVWAVFMGLG
jgi:hypothetical protein